MCVCITGHWSVECIWIMRRWSSNLGNLPLWNLGSVTYCYIAILDPPHPLLSTSDLLSGVSAPSYPDIPSNNVSLVSAQNNPPTRASPISIPEYWYSVTIKPTMQAKWYVTRACSCHGSGLIGLIDQGLTCRCINNTLFL